MKNAILILLAALAPSVLSQRACNNAAHLCDVSYDEATYLGAHNSPFLRDRSTDYSTFGNQYFNTTRQLDAGVRLLSAQVHIARNEVTKAQELHLCHTSCALFDAGLLSDWLFEIRTWMDWNPNEVVTVVLVNPDGIDARELESHYAKADIAHYGYVSPDIRQAPPPSNESDHTWPTLGDMIDKGERLVSLIQPLTPDKDNAPYLLNEFDFAWENAYEVTDPRNFTCIPDRPDRIKISTMRETGRLFLMNHVLYWQQAFGIQVPDDRRINKTNAWEGEGGLGQHITRCSDQVTRSPTFVLVDFFNVGPAIKAVDAMNKVREPVGRKEITEKAVEDIKGAAGPVQAPSFAVVLGGLTALVAILL
jgi:hypothetical protein